MCGALQEFCKALLTAEREKGVKHGLKWQVSHGALQLVLYSAPAEGFRKRKNRGAAGMPVAWPVNIPMQVLTPISEAHHERGIPKIVL